jgi:hypothetical protein
MEKLDEAENKETLAINRQYQKEKRIREKEDRDYQLN